MNLDLSVLNDKQLVDTWGWMQLTVPVGCPAEMAFTAELAKRKLVSNPKPIEFKVLDLTKPGKLKRMR